MANFSFEQILAEIDRQAPIFGVKPEFAKSLLVAENTGVPGQSPPETVAGKTRSPAGALGVLQVMPDTATGLKKAGMLPNNWEYDPANLTSQVQAGLAAMADHQSRMKNPDDLLELAAGYNGSPKVHKAYLSGDLSKLPTETRGYLKKVAAAGTTFGVPGMTTTSEQQLGTPTATPAGTTGTTNTSSSATSRKNVMAPGVLDAFMQQAMGLADTGGGFDLATDAVVLAGSGRKTAASELESAITARGLAAGAAATAEATTAATAAARRAGILTAMNLNPDLVANQALQTTSIIEQTDAQLTQMQPEIQARMNVGFFDNPVEWLINQTRLPGMVEQYNGVVRQQNQSIEKLKTLQSLAASQQNISTAIDADEILKQGQATAKVRATEASADLAKAQMENAGANQREALTLAQLGMQKLNTLGQVAQLTKEQQTERTASTAQASTKALEEQQLADVNRIVVAAGGQPLATLKNLPASRKDQLVSMATSGTFGGTFDTSFGAVLGSDRIGNLSVMSQQGGAATKKWVTATAAKASEQVELVASKPENRGKRFDTEKAMAQALNDMQTLYQRQASTDLRTASDDNPLKLSYVNIAKLPVLANNPTAIFINQYGPAGKEPRYAVVDEQVLLQRYAFSVASGKMKMEQATSAITEFYKVGAQQQALMTSSRLFGLQTPEKTYAVKVPGLGVTKTVDLGNPAQVEALLTYKIAADFRAKNAAILYGRGGSLQRQESAEDLATKKSAVNAAINLE